MSELIVRMEMPKKCIDCCVRSNCELYMNELRKPFEQRDFETIKPLGSKGCLIRGALPEQHGRLIDSDAFKSTIRPLCEEDKFAACTFETVKRLMVEHINNAPTIVPADTAERSET